MEIERLSEKALSDLVEKANQRLERIRTRPPREDVLRAIERLAEESGYTLEELLPGTSSGPSASSRKLGKARIKYVHPTDPVLRWSGRGSKPRWVLDLLSQGHTLEALSVSARPGQGKKEDV